MSDDLFSQPSRNRLRRTSSREARFSYDAADLDLMGGGPAYVAAATEFAKAGFAPEPLRSALKRDAETLAGAVELGPLDDGVEPFKRMKRAYEDAMGPSGVTPEHPDPIATAHLPYADARQMVEDKKRQRQANAQGPATALNEAIASKTKRSSLFGYPSFEPIGKPWAIEPAPEERAEPVETTARSLANEARRAAESSSIVPALNTGEPDAPNKPTEARKAPMPVRTEPELKPQPAPAADSPAGGSATKSGAAPHAAERARRLEIARGAVGRSGAGTFAGAALSESFTHNSLLEPFYKDFEFYRLRIEALGYDVQTDLDFRKEFNLNNPKRVAEHLDLAEQTVRRIEAEYRRKVSLSAADPERKYLRIRPTWLNRTFGGDESAEAAADAARDVAAAGNPWALRDADLRGPDGEPLSEKEVRRRINGEIYRKAGEKVAAERKRVEAMEAAAKGDDPDLPARDASFDRFDIADGVAFDRDILGGGKVYGGPDGGTLLATLKRVERRDIRERSYVDYVLPGAEQIGPVIREDAKGRVYAVQPALFGGVADPREVDVRSAEIVAALPPGHYRVKDVKGETFDPKRQTITAVLIDEDGEEEEREIPIYVLPRQKPIPGVTVGVEDVYDLNIQQPGFAKGVLTPLTIGDRAGREKRDVDAQTSAGWPKRRPRPKAKQVHVVPHKHAAESALIPKGFGGAGLLPADQNAAEGNFYKDFLVKSGIRLQEGARYLQIHIPLDDPFWEVYRGGLPGPRGK